MIASTSEHMSTSAMRNQPWWACEASTISLTSSRAEHDTSERRRGIDPGGLVILNVGFDQQLRRLVVERDVDEVVREDAFALLVQRLARLGIQLDAPQAHHDV